MSSPHLITIGISHYCEKARWALDRAGIDYRESAYLPLFHLPAARAAGGRSTPILVTEHGAFHDSTDILHYADSYLPPAQRLFPDETHSDDVAALEDRLDAELGPAARVWAYAHLLEGDPAATRALLAQRCPRHQAWLFRALQPAIFRLMRQGLRIGPTSADWALSRLQPLFDDLDARLADGRPYLCGDRLSAADITFASLAAPIVDLQDVVPAPVATTRLPVAFVAGRQQFRARPSGAFLARLWQTERSRRLR